MNLWSQWSQNQNSNNASIFINKFGVFYLPRLIRIVWFHALIRTSDDTDVYNDQKALGTQNVFDFDWNERVCVIQFVCWHHVRQNNPKTH